MKKEEINKHIISSNSTIKDALRLLNKLGTDLTLFVVTDSNVAIGAVTDGDIRRALLKDIDINDTVQKCMYEKFRYIFEEDFSFESLKEFRTQEINIIPVLDNEKRIVDILNLKNRKSILPIEAVLMAGGKGVRLKPITDSIPKPLIKIGGTPIIERNIDRLVKYGVKNINLSINYLGNKISDYFGDGSKKDVNINYIKETEALGTIGSVKLYDDYKEDIILVMNSDILTNIDFEEMYMKMIQEKADFVVASIPYQVDIPYAVLSTVDGEVQSLKEKPSYLYYSNAGIYLIRKENLEYIPDNAFFNATDLMEKLIELNKKVIQFPILGYWLDIGKPEDMMQAEKDISRIKF